MTDFDKQLVGSYLQVAIDKAEKAPNPTTGLHLIRLAARDVVAHLKGEADMTGIFQEVIHQSKPALAA